MLAIIIPFIAFDIFISNSRLICYFNNDISVIFDEDIDKLILPQTFIFRIIEEIYTKDLLIVNTTKISHSIIRYTACNALMSISHKAPKDHIQINTFEIRAEETEESIALFKVETIDDTTEYKVELESVDSDLKMLLHIISLNNKDNYNKYIQFDGKNFNFKINSSYTYDCIFIKAQKLNLFFKLPTLFKWPVENLNKMVRWKIILEYKYRSEIINGTMEYYALKTHCFYGSPAFDFVLKHHPHNVKIKLSAIGKSAERVFDVEFSYERSKLIITTFPDKQELGFEPKFYDINNAFSKDNRIQNLVLEPLTLWGTCSSSSNKLATINIYKRFGYIYYHYGLYPFFHPTNNKLKIWKPLSYAELENKVTNYEISCKLNINN